MRGSLARKIGVFLHVGGASRRSEEGGPEAIRAAYRQAPEAVTPAQRLRLLWRVESLAYRGWVEAPDGPSLAGAGLPVRLQPTLHLGLGLAAVQHRGFEADVLEEWIRERCLPGHEIYAWEAVGAALACYQRDAFGALVGACGRLGLLIRRPLPAPTLETFLETQLKAVPPVRRRAVAHGWGRLLFFKSRSYGRALRRARELPEAASALRGVGFARTFVSLFREKQRLGMEKLPGPVRSASVRSAAGQPESGGSGGETVAEALEAAVVNALVYLEWSVPGLMSSTEPALPRRSVRRDLALRAKCRLAEAAYGDGPLPFDLGAGQLLAAPVPVPEPREREKPSRREARRGSTGRSAAAQVS